MAGIYIHIPYCKQACHYCNFHFSTNLGSSEAMVLAMQAEMKMRASELDTQTIETIYFGGGTPGILPSDDIAKMIELLYRHYAISKNAEITIEVNPDDMHPQKLKEYLRIGINRLSVGTQSFFAEDLVYMNRSHDAKAATRCVQDAQDAGIDNISIDLIYGFPLLTNTKWRSNVQTALQLGVTHLSAYAMTVENRTALEKMIRTKQVPDIDTAQSATQFTSLMHWMQEANWEHYEISNFAKPNHRAKHNTNYWLGENYIGIGPSAHSFDGGSRQWNIANNNIYIKEITLGNLPAEKEILTPHQQINEYIMTSLRMSDGMHLQKIKAVCNDAEWAEFMQQLSKNNSMVHIDNDIVVLNNTGKLYADKIASDLFVGV